MGSTVNNVKANSRGMDSAVMKLNIVVIVTMSCLIEIIIFALTVNQ